MKKIILILVLAVAVPVITFAAHPFGWGVGVMGQYNLAWDGFDGGTGAALSLKAPQLPVYWGISLEIRNHALGLSVTGDRYLIDRSLSNDINLGWFLGLGAYAGFHTYNYDTVSWTSIRGGARVPIGLYIFPVNFLEVFVDVAPSLGLGLYFGDYIDTFHFPEGGIGLDLGLRFWF